MVIQLLKVVLFYTFYCLSQSLLIIIFWYLVNQHMATISFPVHMNEYSLKQPWHKCNWCIKPNAWTFLKTIAHRSHSVRILFVRFCLNVIWHALSVFEASRKLCHWHTVMCRDWLCCVYNHMADVVSPSSPLAFVTKMSEKHKSASPKAVQTKNWWKTVGIEKKLDVISQLQKVEWIADMP
jgi:hypothetical protein